jgi:16S rRNA (guanine527-N7)-methyltransferase
MTRASVELPAAPSAAAAVFGDRLPGAVQYAELLAGAGVERGIVGPRETGRLWDRHLLNCAGLAELLAPGERVLDLGSGAGLPGLVLGLLRDDITIELVEPLLRRATFLTEAVEALGLTHVRVRRARGEEIAGKVEADVVTARAVAPLDRLAGWSLPLLRCGGRLLALKGEQADTELAAARPGLRKAGAESAEVVTVGTADNETLARVVVVVRGPRAADRRKADRR